MHYELLASSKTFHFNFIAKYLQTRKLQILYPKITFLHVPTSDTTGTFNETEGAEKL